MRKSIRNRLAIYLLYAALALMFFFFDLDLLGWLFGTMFVVPLIIGFLIMIWKIVFRNQVVEDEEEDDDDYELTPQEKIEQQERLDTLEEAGEMIQYFKELNKAKAQGEKNFPSFEKWQKVHDLDVTECDHEWVNHHRSNIKYCTRCDEVSRR